MLKKRTKNLLKAAKQNKAFYQGHRERNKMAADLRHNRKAKGVGHEINKRLYGIG